jgi:1-deoxy-D-xylulose-5-phosphate reductoisomerase
VTRVLVLGSTGSIGVQALDVIAANPDLECCGLSCGRQLDAMSVQAQAHGVAVTACADGGGTIAHSADLAELIEASAPDIVLNALVGAAGLAPTLSALERGITVGLANKESLVVGGELVAEVCGRTGAGLVPVDSEHSALWQLLEATPKNRVRSLVVTASGGPFRGRNADELAEVTVADALAHPTWTMGAKITIDSATLMNKGLEVIEAHHLFDTSYDDIEVVVHPQSVIHAMVRLDDGSVLSHMGPPDMRVPIAYALRWPEAPPRRAPIDLLGRTLTFEPPDEDTFRCLPLAREAGRVGGTAPAVLNAANEVAVAAFLDGRTRFLDIAEVVAGALDAVPVEPADSLETVLAADRHARQVADDLIAAVVAR